MVRNGKLKKIKGRIERGNKLTSLYHYNEVINRDYDSGYQG